MKKKGRPKFSRGKYAIIYDVVTVCFVLCVVSRVFFSVTILPSIMDTTERLPCLFKRFIPFYESGECGLRHSFFSFEGIEYFINDKFNYFIWKVPFVTRIMRSVVVRYFQSSSRNMILFCYACGVCYFVVLMIVKCFKIRLLVIDFFNVLSGVCIYVILHQKYTYESTAVYINIFVNLNILLFTYLVCKKYRFRLVCKILGPLAILYWSSAFLYFQLGSYRYSLLIGYFMQVFFYAMIYEMKSTKSEDFSIMKTMGYLNFFPSWIVTGPLEIEVYNRWHRNLEKEVTSEYYSEKKEEEEVKNEKKRRDSILFILKRHFDGDFFRDLLFASFCSFLTFTILEIGYRFAVFKTAHGVLFGELNSPRIVNVSVPWYWINGWVAAFEHRMSLYFANSAMSLIPIIMGIRYEDVMFTHIMSEFSQKTSSRLFSYWNLPHVKFLRYCVYFPLKNGTSSHIFAQVVCVVLTVCLHSINDSLIIAWIIQMLAMDTFKNSSRKLSRNKKWVEFVASFDDKEKRSNFSRWIFKTSTSILMYMIWVYISVCYFCIDVFNNGGAHWTTEQTINHIRHGSGFVVEYIWVVLFVVLNFLI